jgi:hypothetical protein
MPQKGKRMKQLPRHMLRLTLIFVAVAGFCGALGSTPALAQEQPKGAASATVRFEQIQVAFIGSGSMGGGTLRYGGKSYPITIGGLGVGGMGASRLTASGSVYGLSRKEDFAGAYMQVRSGWALADRGRGTLWLRNSNGVTMKLNVRRQGLQTALGADGVLIGFQ